MNVFHAAGRAVTKTADATTAAAATVANTAVEGLVGGVQGVTTGVRDGATSGSRSTVRAALTLGAIGAAGLVEWPLLVGVGGTALVVHQLSNHRDGQPSPSSRSAPAASAPSSASEPNSPTKRTRRRRRRLRRHPRRKGPPACRGALPPPASPNLAAVRSTARRRSGLAPEPSLLDDSPRCPSRVWPLELVQRLITVTVRNVTNPGDLVTLRAAARAADAEHAGCFYRLLRGQHAELVAHLKLQREVLSRCEGGADQSEVRRASTRLGRSCTPTVS
jgi:hypothetical protein